MAYRDTEYDDDELEGGADLDDREDPDASDMDDDDDPPLVPCPYCGREISEEAEVCPHCRNFISAEDAPRGRPRWVIVAGVVLCLLIVLIWVLAHG